MKMKSTRRLTPRAALSVAAPGLLGALALTAMLGSKALAGAAMALMIGPAEAPNATQETAAAFTDGAPPDAL